MGNTEQRTLIFAPGVEAALADLPEGLDPLGAGQSLRRTLPAEVARAAAELRELRIRASGRLPMAGRLLLTRKALEQATDARVAAARATILGARLGPVDGPAPWILDGTCGLGSDAAALARAGLRVVAADADLLVARCARHNLGVWGFPTRVVAARAEAPALRGVDFLLLDPDRRRGATREGDPERWSPAWGTVAALLGRVRGAVVKLAPGVRVGALAETLPEDLPASWCWVSLDGELKEVALWTGELADRGPSALVLRQGKSWRLEASPGGARIPLPAPPDPAATRFLADPDAAVLAANLLGTLAHRSGLAPLGPASVYLGGPEAPPDAARPFLDAFRVLGEAPLDRRRLRGLLARHDIGPLTVKKRALPESADELARRFTGPGARPGILVCTRLERGRHGFLVERLPRAGGA